MASHELIQRKKARFLKFFEECGNITRAAELARINRRDHYIWLDSDPEYKTAFAESQKIAGDALEAECYRRALDGVDEPVFYQGQECGTVRKFSDTLAIFLLKGAMPDKYKERVASTISNPDGTPILSGVKVEYVGEK